MTGIISRIKKFLGMEVAAHPEIIAALAGSVAVVEHGISKLGATVFSELKMAITAASEAAYTKATGGILDKLAAAGSAAKHAGLDFFKQGDLEHLAEDFVSNLIHALATSAASEAQK